MTGAGLIAAVLAAAMTAAACDGESSDDGGAGADAAPAADASVATDASTAEPWTLIVVPDTQRYADAFPDIFKAQTNWIAEHAAELDVRYVLHVGDVTEFNAPDEWQVARESFLDLIGIVPFAVVPGNHDYIADQVRTSGLTATFPVAEFDAMAGAGGIFEADRLDNSYHLFEAGDESWLVLALEWGPREAVLAWANGVIDAHPDRQVIVLTHAYLYIDSTRYDWAAKGVAQDWNPHSYSATRWPEVNDGQQIWDALIADRDNVRFVICGHAAREGLGRQAAVTDVGATVYELLANFQDYANGGAGYLRIMRFFPDRVEVQTYSPWLDAYYEGPENQFTLTR